ncbi:MAG: 30S ribosomal protein S8 [Clostridiales Family XIII bacterium]|jgi:small subunit ribosomal protein S8|nr:30S ribosomal protein S8 [Clostridiales Family XIII bacterium]
MTMTDPIADMLTRIRNANTAYHGNVSVPLSKMKKEIVKILKDEGYIADFEIIGIAPKQEIKITMKYKNKERVISGIKKISKPGLKVYAQVSNVPKVLGGLGVAVLSTSKGIVTDKKARELKTGGEIVCFIW